MHTQNIAVPFRIFSDNAIERLITEKYKNYPDFCKGVQQIILLWSQPALMYTFKTPMEHFHAWNHEFHKNM